MLKYILFVSLSVSSLQLCAQYTSQKFEGKLMALQLGWGGSIMNEGSSLKTEHYAINDQACPIELSAVGVLVNYEAGSGYTGKYSFRAKGVFSVSSEVQAASIVHILYDPFGEHIKSLRDLIIKDITGTMQLDHNSSWYATPNQAMEFMTSVSFVESVRLKDGTVWKYSDEGLNLELKKVKLSFLKSYLDEKGSE